MTDRIEIQSRNHIANKALTAITFKFSGNEEKSRVFIDAKEVSGSKIVFMLMTEEDYRKIETWWEKHPANPKSTQPVYVKYPPEPSTNRIFQRDTNIIDKEFEIDNNITYAWVLNNTNSILTSKVVQTKIIIFPALEKNIPKENLTSYDHFKDQVSKVLYRDLKNANECFREGHYRQCAVMLRAAIETAIRLKADQEGFKDELIDKNGKEKDLTKKLDLLQTKNIILSNIKTDVENTTKKFGDWGVHSNTEIVNSDIIKIVEPSFRNFLTAINLK